MGNWLLGAGAAGWVIAGLLFWQLQGVRDDLVTEIASCNTRITELARAGDQEAAEARIAALERELQEKETIAAQQAGALEIASQALSEAENRPERVRVVTKEVLDEHACLGADVPAAVLDSLR